MYRKRAYRKRARAAFTGLGFWFLVLGAAFKDSLQPVTSIVMSVTAIGVRV